MKKRFLDKLIDRVDKLDPKSLQDHFLYLAQERGLLETIFQSIQEGVLVIDGTGKLTYANKAAEHLIGFSYEEVRGRPILKYLRDIDWEQILRLGEAEWSKLLSQEIEITYPEHKFVSFYVVPLSIGSERKSNMSTRSNPAASNDGAVIILRDVTRDKEHEATVVESERLNAIKLLAAGVAHEIGNPLNALNIHLQLLEREIRDLTENEDGDQGSHEYKDGQLNEMNDLIRIARNEVSRLDLIITQFLRAIRPSSPEMVPLSIGSLLKESLTLLRHEVENKDITIELTCPEDLPVIHADAGQIKQAIFNIVKNAFQAMPDGGLLKIICSYSDQYLSVCFQDSGTGIKREDFAQIFEPYHTSKDTGSGLGLMIVQRIVQDHGGQIEVASKENEGSSFTIRLPRAEKRIRLLEK